LKGVCWTPNCRPASFTSTRILTEVMQKPRLPSHPPPSCVHLGTGKTTVITRMVEAFVARGMSVLLTSFTHSAVLNQNSRAYST